jgi:hypothetical protein
MKKVCRISHWFVELEAKERNDVLSDIASVEKIGKGLYMATFHGQAGDYTRVVPSEYCHFDK